MFQVTDIDDMLQAAGIPVTFIVLFTPAVVLSGTASVSGPEQNCTEVLLAVELVKRTAGSPKHMVTDEGVIFGAGGV